MRILHLDSSPLGNQSVTRHWSEATVEHLLEQHPDATVEHADLAQDPLPHWSPQEATGHRSQKALQQFLEADVVVVGAPMYNFSVPSQLKAWIDHIAVVNQTFRYNAKGEPEGLATEKEVWIVSGRGGKYPSAHPMDFQESYLAALFGFLGVTRLHWVRAEGLALGPDQRAAAFLEAQKMLPAVSTIGA